MKVWMEKTTIYQFEDEGGELVWDRMWGDGCYNMGLLAMGVKEGSELERGYDMDMSKEWVQMDG